MTIEFLANTDAIMEVIASKQALDQAGVLQALQGGAHSLFRQGAIDSYITGGWAARSVAAQEALIVQGGTPSYAWDLYSAAQGQVSSLGAATGGSGGLTTLGPTAVIKPPAAASATPYGLAGVLSAPVSGVAIAAGALAGVGIGIGLYEANPELWTKISRTLLPWAYPDSDDVPVVMDKDGQTYLPKDMVEALQDLFEEEGIGGIAGYTSNLDLSPITQPLQVGGSVEDQYTIYKTTNPCWWNSYSGRFEGVAISDTFNVDVLAFNEINKTTGVVTPRYVRAQRTATFNGQTVYYAPFGPIITSARNVQIPYSGRSGMPKQAEVAWTFRFGDAVGQYPEGTEKWGGTMVDISTLPTLPVLRDFGSDPTLDSTSDWIPASLPYDGTELDPYINPDPSQVTDQEKQVDYYYDPTKTPYKDPQGKTIPSPVPDYNPDSDTGPDISPDTPPEDQPFDPNRYPDPTIPDSTGDAPDDPIPTIPLPFNNNAGLIAVYNPDDAILNDFARWLWVTYQDATIQKIWNNPFDGVITLFELYCTPPNAGSRTIRSGFLDSEINCPIINRYTEINCGSIVIPEYWGNYLDYAPYSRAYIYLPFIGIVEVDVDDIVGHAVNITYRIDCYNGSCIAMVRVAKEGYDNLVYQFSGNCAVELPLSGGSQASIKAAIINATAWGLGSVISGLVTAAGSGPMAGLAGASQAINGAMQATASVVNAKSSVQHSGSFGASFGAMGEKRPYIIIRRPIQVQVPNYNLEYGYQAHKLVLIGECTGFLRVREVNVVSSTATDDEKAMIEQLLKTGVYVTS